MKGQFMVISAVIVGIIMITTAGMLNKAQKKRFEVDPTSYQVNMLKQEAASVDSSTEVGRRSFRRLVDMTETYQTSIDYWAQQDCFNVTLQTSDSRFHMNCLD